MAKPENRNAYKSEYRRDSYDQIVITMRKGDRDKVKAVAAKQGISTNQLIIDALCSYAKIDVSSGKD